MQHIAATGAALTDMGDYHGLRRVVARTGDQFVLLSATPDGHAVVAGLMSDLSAADLSQIAGGSLTGWTARICGVMKDIPDASTPRQLARTTSSLNYLSTKVRTES